MVCDAPSNFVSVHMAIYMRQRQRKKGARCVYGDTLNRDAWKPIFNNQHVRKYSHMKYIYISFVMNDGCIRVDALYINTVQPYKMCYDATKIRHRNPSQHVGHQWANNQNNNNK